MAQINDDPKKKKTTRTYQTQAELDTANAEAKRFAVARNLLIGNDAYVGRKIGDPIAPYIDASTGKDITGMPAQSKLPPNTITDIRKVPSYIKAEDIKYNDDNIPYYIDQQTGDIQPIHPDIARSSRFVPTRGQYGNDMALKTNYKNMPAISF